MGNSEAKANANHRRPVRLPVDNEVRFTEGGGALYHREIVRTSAGFRTFPSETAEYLKTWAEERARVRELLNL